MNTELTVDGSIVRICPHDGTSFRVDLKLLQRVIRTLVASQEEEHD